MEKGKEVQVLRKTTLLGRELTVYGNAVNPLFLAKDVAGWIEHSNITAMLQSIDEDEKVKIRPKQSLGLLTNNNEYNFLTEDGLYEVLMQSRKPIAKQFKKGVKVILKEIRTKGGYIATTEEDTPETIMAKALFYADQKIKEQARCLEESQRMRHELEQEAIANQPKIDWVKRNQESKGLHTLTQCLHDLRICADYMNRVLCRYKVIRKLGREYSFTAPYQNKGFGEAIPIIYTGREDEDCTSLQLKYSEKGRRLLCQLVKHAEKDGFIYICKKTGRYSIAKASCNFTVFKFID